jgi:hypothetical protein
LSIYRRTSKFALHICTDSEWDLPTKTWISTAFSDGKREIFFIRDDLLEDIRHRLEAEAMRRGVHLVYETMTDQTNLLEKACTHFNWTGKIRLGLYYSPKDVEYAVGWDNERFAILKKNLHQRNNLSGHIGDVRIKDLFGLSSKQSLKKFAMSLGVPMEDKGLMDEYKKHMMDGLMEHPENYLAYSVGDARALHRVWHEFMGMFNTVQREYLKMPEEDCWSMDDIPMTVGALVAKTELRWLYHMTGEYRDAVKFSLRKLGYLDPDAKWHWRSQHIREAVVSTIRSPEELHEAMDEKSPDAWKMLWFMEKAKYLYTGLDGCSVKWWASRPITESACYNSLAHGARCNNENPFSFSVGRGLDIDITGCYGNALRKMTFPIGLPWVWSYDSNETRRTLGEWLDSNEEQLIDGLWSCVVGGKLSFEQDLVYSKLVKVRNIQKALSSPDREDSAIPSSIVLSRREITNGIITSDILTALKAPATNKEWNEIRKLEVITACAYLRKDRCEDVGDWCRTVMAHEDRYNGLIRCAPRTPQDTRSRAWYGVPLEDFVGMLVDVRKKHKHRSEDAALSSEERERSGGLSEVLKLIVNTVYGVEASRYFTVGNTILGNNITARARVGVWMVAKALGLRQCITDGGIYDPNAVCFWKERKPGLDTLSRQWEWADNVKYRRWHGAMEGLNWNAMDWSALPANIDKLATDHVQKFWKPYGLELPFQLEHKKDNTFTKAAYWSKADYALDIGETTTRRINAKVCHTRQGQKEIRRETPSILCPFGRHS